MGLGPILSVTMYSNGTLPLPLDDAAAARCVHSLSLSDWKKWVGNPFLAMTANANAIAEVSVNRPLGPFYTKHQHQRCDHSAMTLVILFSLKSMETLENGLQTHYGALSQSCCSADADAWCKRARNHNCSVSGNH